MSDTSANLQMPYLAPAQAQKHVTVNQALGRLDALVQGNVISRALAAQPASPVDGDLYMLPPGKTGAAWGAMTNGALAYWRDGVWEQILPREGWTVFVRDEDQHLFWSGAAWSAIVTASAARGFRNRLINSAFAIDQRRATTAADDAYCLDRFYVLTETGSVSIDRLTDPESGRLAGLRLTQPDATPKRIGLAQIAESADIRDLRAQAVAMAARVRCSASQAIRMAILEWTGAVDAVTSDVVDAWNSATFTPGNFFIAGVNVIATGASTPTAATWTDLTQITGTFGASLNNAIVMVWTEATLAQHATLDIDQIQLEPGAACGPFARRPLGEELALCRRFYWKSFPMTTAPAQNAGTNGCLVFPSQGASVNTRVQHAFPETMRATPAVTYFNPGAANAMARDFDAGADCSLTVTLGGSAFHSERVVSFLLGAPAGSAVGNALVVHLTAEAEL